MLNQSKQPQAQQSRHKQTWFCASCMLACLSACLHLILTLLSLLVPANTDLGKEGLFRQSLLRRKYTLQLAARQSHSSQARIWRMGLTLTLNISSLSSRRYLPLFPRKETSPERLRLPTGPTSICLTQTQNLEPRLKLSCKMDFATGEM